MKNLLISLITLLSFAGCANKSEEVAMQPVVEKEGIGPFSVEFASDSTFQKAVSAPISQAEGKIEFFSFADLPSQIVVKDIKLSITGCDASQVQFNLFWIPNLDQAPTKGYEVRKSSRIEVKEKVKSSLVASFKNLQNCTHIDFNLALYRIPLPLATYGSWISNVVAVSEPYHSMRMDISQLSETVQSSFQITCDGGNTERFTTEMLQNNESELPKKMIFKITRVDATASQTCSKQFGIKSTDIGRLIYCVHNRATMSSPFNLACRLNANELTYPTSYTELPTSWQKN